MRYFSLRAHPTLALGNRHVELRHGKRWQLLWATPRWSADSRIIGLGPRGGARRAEAIARHITRKRMGTLYATHEPAAKLGWRGWSAKQLLLPESWFSLSRQDQAEALEFAAAKRVARPTLLFLKRHLGGLGPICPLRR